MKIEMKLFIATVIVIMTSIFLCAAIEYKTIDSQYFTAEYPVDWKVSEHVSDKISYSFSFPSPQGRTILGDGGISVGVNGVDIRFRIRPEVKGMFNEDGSIGESVIHFFETFQVKKPATTNATVEPEYTTYENEYFKVEYPVDWIVYPNEKKLSYNFQVPIPNRSWGANTNVTWNVECFDPAEVDLGITGATIHIQANKDTGSFLNDGFVDKGLIHFLKTFKLKSNPTPKL